MVFECYRQMVELYHGNVSTCGFSSGAALALGIAAHNNALGTPLPQPKHIVAVSPGEVPWNEEERVRMQALDATNVAINFAYLDRLDVILRHGQENVSEYMIAPSRGDYRGVGDIHFFYSADEVLYGALPEFEQACRKAEVPYTSFARPGMTHCYCMLPVLLLIIGVWNHVSDFKTAYGQALLFLEVMNVYDGIVIDKLWVGYSRFWVIPGLEDLPYVQSWGQMMQKRVKLALVWVAGAALAAGMVVLIF